MPARIVAVLDQPGVADKVVTQLTVAGYNATALSDPMVALNALEGATRIEVLVTGLDHGPNKPNGISLALMARSKRPGIRVLFVGDSALAHYAVGVGEFLAEPVAVTEVVEHVIRLSEAPQEPTQ
jgi:DNA-binding NtrC family response regulator